MLCSPRKTNLQWLSQSSMQRGYRNPRISAPAVQLKLVPAPHPLVSHIPKISLASEGFYSEACQPKAATEASGIYLGSLRFTQLEFRLTAL